MLSTLARGSLAVLALLAASSIASAQNGGYRPVEPIGLALDRAGVYTFHFAYTPIRYVEVETSKGKKAVWYMVYQVWNKSDTPQRMVPEFEFVTKDGERRTFLDEPMPEITKKIRTIEDPTGALNIQTTVGIAKDKIPVTKPDSVPRAVYGVAIWVDAPEKASTSNNFSVYVTGLSNGLAVQEKEGGETISRKTLQIDFSRPTDNTKPRVDDIRPNDNNGLGSEKWIYRVIPVKKPAAAPAP
ncbi:MAG: hypothetical protein ACRC8S_08835 [Fimbriiglobus sp.]